MAEERSSPTTTTGPGVVDNDDYDVDVDENFFNPFNSIH